MDRLNGPLDSWSYSTFSNFQKCPRRVYLDKVLKEPKPELIVPEGKTEHPLDRGIRVHDAAEAFLKEDCELIGELQSFVLQFEMLKYLKERGEHQFVIEDKWAFTKDWIPCGWSSEDAFLRLKMDCFLKTEIEAILIDYKTGHKHGNEISHMTQAQLYQLCALLRFPELQHVQVEFWYLDQKEIMSIPFTREFGMRFLGKFDEVGKRITSEIHFNPKPSANACRFCPFGHQVGTDVCASAYK